MQPLFDPQRMLSIDHPNGFVDSRPRITPERFVELVECVRESAWSEGIVRVVHGSRIPDHSWVPSLAQLTKAAEAHFARYVPSIVSAWSKIIMAHRSDGRVREFLAVPSSLLGWVDSSPIEDYRVDFCRFDVVGDDVASARIVEFNANCPGGIVYTSAYTALWRAFPEVRQILDDWSVASTRLDDRHWFPQFLLETAAARNGDNGHTDGPIGIFHKPGGNVLELDKIADLLTEIGHEAVQTEPGAGDWLRADTRIGYLKYGVQATLADIGRWGNFLDRVVSGHLRLVNPLPGRWIGDNKLCLAVLSDPRFGSLFTADEQEAIERLIPYSRKVADGVEPSELIADRASWVIKGPYDTRGNAVYIGGEQQPNAWRVMVAQAAEHGWLAQAAIPPSRRNWCGKDWYQDLSIVLLAGRWAGYASRMSENLRVNVAQGGCWQLVFGHSSTDWNTGVRA
jgi:hypothetical protein